MAIRTKTVEYWFPFQNSIPDNTKTALTQITIDLPETSGTARVFKDVYVEVVFANTDTTGINSRYIELTLEGASPVSAFTTIAISSSGENIVANQTADFTSYFIDNFGSANSSRTLDCSLTIDSSTAGLANLSVKVVITYAFDDSNATHLRTVWIPLNSPKTYLPTTKTIADTIPALDTYLPEANKTYKQIAIVVQGNQQAASTTDIYLYLDVDSENQLSALYERGGATASWFRGHQLFSFNTSVTHDFYLWASLSPAFHFPQVYMVVTYTFTPSSSSSMLVSVLLPHNVPTLASVSGNSQKTEVNFSIQEENPVMQRLAIYLSWDQNASATLGLKVGTNASYTVYSSPAAVTAGSCVLMERAESLHPALVRGNNVFYYDTYKSTSLQMFNGLSGFWILNYTCDIPSQGYWAANHTVFYGIFHHNSLQTAPVLDQVTNAVTTTNVDSSFYYNSLSSFVTLVSNFTGQYVGFNLSVRNDEDTAWLDLGTVFTNPDPEAGMFVYYLDCLKRNVFQRWNSDIGIDRISLDRTSPWRIVTANTTTTSHFINIDLIITYHSIVYTVTGSIQGSSGGLIDITLFDSNNNPLKSTSRTGNGPFSINWHDNTNPVYVTAKEGSNLVGISILDYATGNP